MDTVILLPGIVLPATEAYTGLLQSLSGAADAIAKELEVYAGDEPPPGYGLETEITGVLDVIDRRGNDRVHLVGYSAGGAVAFAFTTRHPDRVSSLALLEPAWLGNAGIGPGERRVREAFARAATLPPDQMLAEFTRLQLAPGVEPPAPPPGPPPAWMRKRPGGIRAILRAFDEGDAELDVLGGSGVPVYYALGSRSNPEYFGEMAARCRSGLPDVTVEVFDERHHFDPPHRVEPDRLARSLRAWWRSHPRG
ncbi:alpha/beta fold hydrolase [Agromyces sp. Marseille-P2726]|uniref:alpha/beta fold hydrolase n=1 Tax=Agromyces sp. Marseille-P2726 TaxID=2709132 RepID=UPI0015709C7A|nr:alpha/beta hydrolase [Agromyces sp. Marseille-P2726]